MSNVKEQIANQYYYYTVCLWNTQSEMENPCARAFFVAGWGTPSCAAMRVMSGHSVCSIPSVPWARNLGHLPLPVCLHWLTTACHYVPSLTSSYKQHLDDNTHRPTAPSGPSICRLLRICVIFIFRPAFWTTFIQKQEPGPRIAAPSSCRDQGTTR